MIFTDVFTNISGYTGLFKLKPFKFASNLRKPHLPNAIRSKVIQLWMK